LAQAWWHETSSSLLLSPPASPVMEPPLRRSDAIHQLSARLGFALRQARASFSGSDVTVFIEPIADVLEDLGTALRHMRKSSGLAAARPVIREEVPLLAALASRPPTASSPTTPTMTMQGSRPTASSPVKSVRFAPRPEVRPVLPVGGHSFCPVPSGSAASPPGGVHAASSRWMRAVATRGLLWRKAQATVTVEGGSALLAAAGGHQGCERPAVPHTCDDDEIEWELFGEHSDYVALRGRERPVGQSPRIDDVFVAELIALRGGERSAGPPPCVDDVIEAELFGDPDPDEPLTFRGCERPSGPYPRVYDVIEVDLHGVDSDDSDGALPDPDDALLRWYEQGTESRRPDDGGAGFGDAFFHDQRALYDSSLLS